MQKFVKRLVRKVFWSVVSGLLKSNKAKQEFFILSTKDVGPIAKLAADDCETKEVLSVREVGNNSGEAVKKYLAATNLGVGNPWCMAFCVYRLIKAAHRLCRPIPADFPRSASTNVVANWGKKNGLFIPRSEIELGKALPKRGDLAFYSFAATGKIGHVGIIVAVTKTGFYAVEGNTGPDKNGQVNADGQGVYRKFRTWKSLGLTGGVMRIPF